MIKKYCLLEDNTIEPCYYSNGELRNIYKEGRYYYIEHDVFGNGCMIRFCHRILKFANTKKELKEWLKCK